MPVDRETFRALAGSFPTGVTVVTSLDPAGAPRGLTTQAFIGLSTEPPLVLVSLDRTSRTLAALRAHGAFVVNFLRSGSEALATAFATKDEDKFAGVAWTPAPGARGAPILAGAVCAYAECLVTEERAGGDHVLFVGQVEGGRVEGGAPLLYYRRTYAAWPEESPAPSLR